MRSLYLNGVRHAVISPGSRSTPLTLAAAIHPGIKKKVVLDERSAAFIALGIGKSSGTPAILICTSGSALANYFPAVVEASQSGVPMIILSADRPPLLRGIGSSQTIDQLKIFGDYTPFFHDTGEPNFKTDDLKRIAYLGKQAVEKSLHHNGPVHINLPFRKPLEPDKQTLHEETEKSIQQFELLENESRTQAFSSVICPAGNVATLLEKTNKPLIICGPSGTSHSLDDLVQTVSKHLNAPVIAEPGSNVDTSDKGFIKRYEQFLLRNESQKSLKPDLIIRFGNQPYTKSLLTTLANWSDLPVLHFNSNNSTQDHEMSVTEKVIMKPYDRIDLSDVKIRKSSDWIELWKKADTESENNLADSLQEVTKFTDAHIINFFSKQLDERWNIMISNSFTVRDMALFGSSATNQFVNRGAAGIDGINSTAIGILTASDKPTCCLIGDLAFYHDSNALLSLTSALEAPLITVVVNNGGGTIFRMLPVYQSESLKIPDQLFESYFETPQYSSIQKLAESASVQYRRIESISELIQLDLWKLSEHTVIECITDADETMILRKKLWAG